MSLDTIQLVDTTTLPNGRIEESYRAKQRKSDFTYVRSAFHAGASIMTLGLWEVVGTPMEGALADTGWIAFTAQYDQDYNLLSSRIVSVDGDPYKPSGETEVASSSGLEQADLEPAPPLTVGNTADSSLSAPLLPPAKPLQTTVSSSGNTTTTVEQPLLFSGDSSSNALTPGAGPSPIAGDLAEAERLLKEAQQNNSNLQTSGGSALETASNAPTTSNVRQLPSVSGGRYAVQVGAFGNRNNATRLVQRIENAGMPTFTRPQRNLTAVRLGPYGSRSEASAAARSYRQAFGGQAVIVRN
ncbi:MAG: SPOR domain-containing protein [Pseudomonadota bacterium]